MDDEMDLWPFIEGKLFGSSLPHDSQDIARIEEAGIRTVITLTEEPLPGELRPAGLRFVHIPIEDFGVPSMEQVDEFLAECRKGPMPILVHCFGGYGRTGTMATLYLMAMDGMAFRDALSLVRSRRPGSVESEPQMTLLENLGREKPWKSARGGKNA